MENVSKNREPIGGPSWPEERARYGEYAPGSLEPRDTCECGSRLKDGWCATCREFIWRSR